MKVGVLAIQGDVPEHERAFRAAQPNAEVLSIRTRAALEQVDALCLPGGESTTIAKLLEDNRLFEPLRVRIDEGLPVLATCAGLILLSERLERSAVKDPRTLGALDVTVRRNDYGRQRESFEAGLRVEGISGPPFPGVFIRAPRILSVGPKARPFAFRGEEVVGVRQGRLFGLAFHPELSQDPRIHRLFLSQSVVPTNP
jgi:pyridoxal 5'-phosphate synthase pdxT subunit